MKVDQEIILLHVLTRGSKLPVDPIRDLFYPEEIKLHSYA